MTADHIIPFSQGGTDHPHNLACAHVTCNMRRGNRPAEQVQTELAAERERLEPTTTGWKW